MKTFLSLCAGAAFCILASCSEGPTKQMPYNQGINVIPTPVSLVQNEGSFKLSKNTAFSASTPEAKTVAEYFAAQMNLATGYQITVSDKAASNGIALAIDEALDVNDEGYTLDVTPQGVTVKAKTPQGLFYGMQTFMQLLPAEIQSPAVVNGIAWTTSLPSFHPGRERKETSRRTGFVQDQPHALASDGRPGLAYRNQEIPKTDRSRFQTHRWRRNGI